MSAIRSVTISGVRGIRTQLCLPLDGKSLLLRGDNGTGKSSIAQALRWALTGSATGRNAAPLAPENVRHRLEPDPKAAKVSVELSATSRILLEGDSITFEGEGAAFRAACERANPFLRREELVAVVRDQPGDRFKYFQSFLDLGPVDRLCADLNQETKRRSDGVKQLKRKRDDLLQQASSHLSGPGSVTTGAQIITAATAAGQNLGLRFPEQSSWSDIEAAVGMASSGAHSPEALQRRQQLVSAVGSAGQLVPPAQPAGVLTALREAEERAREADLLPLLAQALTSIEHLIADRCPVCEQDIQREALARRLRERVSVLQDVRTLGSAATDLALLWQQFLEQLEQLERVASCATEQPAARPTGRALLEELASSSDDLSLRTLTRLDGLRRRLEQELTTIPDAAAMGKLRELSTAVSALSPIVERLRATEAELAKAERHLGDLKVVEKAVGDARKAVASEILDAIGSVVAKFYGAIHPASELDEPTGAPTVDVQGHGSGTAYIRGSFAGKAIDDPQQLYSDGHLDTIGICIFLALRRSRADRERENDPKLMVLDDIIMSIDMGHSKRLIELLRDEFSDHQILIFSHNELFMRLCRGPLNQAKRFDINRWRLEDGPRLVPHVSDVAYLRATLEESGSQIQIASAMRIALDDFLVEATGALEVSLRSGTRPLTVSDYWGPLRKKLREVRKAFGLVDLEPIFKRIGEPEFFRNALGAHLNDWARDAELRQVQEVAQALLDLIDALSCAQCRAVVRPRLPNDVAAGLACDCRKGICPTLKKVGQNGAAPGVEAT